MDVDNQMDNSAPNGKWTHLVVCMDQVNGKLDFYVNGKLTKSWDSSTLPLITGTTSAYSKTLPLLIGEGFTYEHGMSIMGSEGWWQSKQSFPHYAGLMDELKVYNIALDAGQVAKLYKDENK